MDSRSNTCTWDQFYRGKPLSRLQLLLSHRFWMVFARQKIQLQMLDSLNDAMKKSMGMMLSP